MGDEIQPILATLCAAGPVLYIGLVMLLDPFGFLILRAIARIFDEGCNWQQARQGRSGILPAPPATRYLIRGAGFMVSFIGLAAVIEASV